MAKEKAHIKVLFDKKGRAEFDIYTTSDEQILRAIMGLEGYLAAKTGLEAVDIRELIDDEKRSVKVLVEG